MNTLLSNLTYLPGWLQLVTVLLSVLVLWYGSEKVIWGVKRIARKMRVSELIIGLTLVSIGSSLPEIFVNISAGLRGADDIGVGNIVGSCFVQISFILGICVMIGGSLKETRKSLKRDGSVLLLANAIVFFLGLNGHISAIEGAFLMCGYILFLWYLVESIQQSESRKLRKDPAMKVKRSVSNLWLNVTAFLTGGILIWLAAEVLLVIGIHTGEELGISQSIIGLFAGVGTSIPELSISLMAILRKSVGISVGNLIGSNITDPLFSLGIGAVVSDGYEVSNFLLYTAIPIWFMASVFAMGVFWFEGRMHRWPAVILIGFYLLSFYMFLT